MSENAERPARSGRGTGEKERPTASSVLTPAYKEVAFYETVNFPKIDNLSAVLYNSDRENDRPRVRRSRENLTNLI